METLEKVQRRKRKKELDDREDSGLPESDVVAIKHKRKRLHRSSSDVHVGHDSAILSTEKQEQMLDTVSGHIRELTVKEVHLNRGDSNKTNEVTMAGSKSRRTKKGRNKLEDATVEKVNTLGNGSSASGDENTAVDVTSTGVSQESALEYLRLWKEERERWSFKKKTQYWLLQNMYERTKVSSHR